ncbi:Hypothetical_protein [Hexamita inflata]|uniref:Hypothetical_protein n=1 Tax=Hexamita inflata TaxID=28002 RepID=A0AA86UY05_9EUKA|nr:Hypothetical protein HINF_LOCUS56747 [Hexamita inflata]
MTLQLQRMKHILDNIQPFEPELIKNVNDQSYQIVYCNFYQSYISSFDIASVTNSITGASFSTGYVFAQTQNIKNAFIDIADNVYSSQVSPLFQNQVQYYNIKIQMGAQTFSQSGTILSGTSEVIISSMNIISRKDTTLSNLAALHILQSTSTSSYILGLMININLTNGQGNISLISSMVGTLNIKNYQLSGSFESTGTVALGALYSISSQIKVNRFNFNPNSFTVGNASSYLFTSICQSQVEITRATLQIGSISITQIICTISSTQYNYFQFGGIASQINDSNTVIAEISYTSFIALESQFVNTSGMVIGMIKSGSILLEGVCHYSSISGQSFLDNFGMLGQVNGNLTFKNSNVALLLNCKAQLFGAIGNLSYSSDINNIQVQVQAISTNLQYISGLVAKLTAQCYINNIKVFNSSVKGSCYVSVIIGYSTMYLKVSAIQVQNTTIKAVELVAGVVLGSSESIKIICEQISIQDSNITSPSAAGGISSCGQSLSLTYCKFDNLQITSTCSGSIYGQLSGVAIVQNCKFTKNQITGSSASTKILIGYFSGSSDKTSVTQLGFFVSAPLQGRSACSISGRYLVSKFIDFSYTVPLQRRMSGITIIVIRASVFENLERVAYICFDSERDIKNIGQVKGRPRQTSKYKGINQNFSNLEVQLKRTLSYFISQVQFE